MLISLLISKLILGLFPIIDYYNQMHSIALYLHYFIHMHYICGMNSQKWNCWVNRLVILIDVLTASSLFNFLFLKFLKFTDGLQELCKELYTLYPDSPIVNILYFAVFPLSSFFFILCVCTHVAIFYKPFESKL